MEKEDLVKEINYQSNLLKECINALEKESYNKGFNDGANVNYKWNYCDDGIYPNDSRNVLVTIKIFHEASDYTDEFFTYEVCVGYYYNYNKEWFVNGMPIRFRDNSSVIAWGEFPKSAEDKYNYEF